MKFIKKFEKFSIKESIDIDIDDKFELGTPVVYHSINWEGKQIEQTGEVVLNKEEYKGYSPRTIKGISLYKDSNYSGDGYRFIVPKWSNVETFYEANDRGDNIFIVKN